MPSTSKKTQLEKLCKKDGSKVQTLFCCQTCKNMTTTEQMSNFLKAAKTGNVVELRRLYTENPLVVTSYDENTDTALTLAAKFADKNTVQFLIEEVAMDETKTGYRGKNCFLAAATSNKLETLKYLNSKFPTLKNGRDEDGNTASDLSRLRETG